LEAKSGQTRTLTHLLGYKNASSDML